MTPTTLISFVKANSGAAVAIALMYFYIGKLETRVEQVEQKYEDCNRARTEQSRNNKGAPVELVHLEAVLPDGSYKPKNIRRVKA